MLVYQRVTGFQMLQTHWPMTILLFNIANSKIHYNPFFLLLKTPPNKNKKNWCGTSVFFLLSTIGFLIVDIEN